MHISLQFSLNCCSVASRPRIELLQSLHRIYLIYTFNRDYKSIIDSWEIFFLSKNLDSRRDPSWSRNLAPGVGERKKSVLRVKHVRISPEPPRMRLVHRMLTFFFNFSEINQNIPLLRQFKVAHPRSWPGLLGWALRLLFVWLSQFPTSVVVTLRSRPINPQEKWYEYISP